MAPFLLNILPYPFPVSSIRFTTFQFFPWIFNFFSPLSYLKFCQGFITDFKKENISIFAPFTLPFHFHFPLQYQTCSCNGALSFSLMVDLLLNHLTGMMSGERFLVEFALWSEIGKEELRDFTTNTLLFSAVP